MGRKRCFANDPLRGKVEARAIKRKRIASLTRHFQNQPVAAVTAIFVADMHVDGVGADLERGG